MYGSDAGQPMPSLYTKGLSPLCDSELCVFVELYVELCAIFLSPEAVYVRMKV